MKNITIIIAIILISVSYAINSFAQDEHVNIHGFLSQGYLQTTRNNLIAESKDGTFQFNEMGLNFGYQALDKLFLGIQFFARDLGSVGNDEIQIDYAVADYRLKDYFGIRAGRMKNPMGIYSEFRDVDILRTSILLPFSVYDENLRDSQTYLNGVGAYGDINTDKLGSISYQAIIGTNNISADSATAVFLGANPVHITSVNMDTNYTYSLYYSDPTGHLRIGGTASFTALGSEGKSTNFLEPLVPSGSRITIAFDNIEIYTGSFEYTWNKLLLTYELKYSKVRDVVYTWPDSPIGSLTIEDLPIDQIGRYIMLNYQLTDFLSLCIYNDVFYPYKDDKKGHHPYPGYTSIQHWSKKWSFSTKIILNSNWLLKFETDYTYGAASVPAVYNDIENNLPDLKEYWWLYAVKLSYNF